MDMANTIEQMKAFFGSAQEQAEKHQKAYGSQEEMAVTASKIGSILLGRDVSPYEVAIVKMCIELACMAENRQAVPVYQGVATSAFMTSVLASRPESVMSAIDEDIKKLAGASASNVRVLVDELNQIDEEADKGASV